MLKRLAPVLVLLTGAALLVLPSATAGSSAQPVSIIGYDYTPKTVTITLGGTVTWTNTSTQVHTSTSSPFWNSHDLSPHGGVFSETDAFLNAGSYSYHCVHHSTIIMAPGTVAVRMQAPPRAAGGFTVTWSNLSSAPTNRSFTVQIRRPGDADFQPFKTGTTVRHVAFNPTKSGKYRFEARTNVVPGTKHSGWSPVLVVTIP